MNSLVYKIKGKRFIMIIITEQIQLLLPSKVFLQNNIYIYIYIYSASSDLSHPDLSTKPDSSTLFYRNENVTNRERRRFHKTKCKIKMSIFVPLRI